MNLLPLPAPLSSPLQALQRPFNHREVEAAHKQMEAELKQNPTSASAPVYQDLLDKFDKAGSLRGWYLEAKPELSPEEVHELRARKAFPNDDQTRQRYLYVKREIQTLLPIEKGELDAWEKFKNPRAVELWVKEQRWVDGDNVIFTHEEKIELETYREFLPFEHTSLIVSLMLKEYQDGYLEWSEKRELSGLKKEARSKNPCLRGSPFAHPAPQLARDDRHHVVEW